MVRHAPCTGDASERSTSHYYSVVRRGRRAASVACRDRGLQRFGRDGEFCRACYRCPDDDPEWGAICVSDCDGFRDSPSLRVADYGAVWVSDRDAFGNSDCCANRDAFGNSDCCADRDAFRDSPAFRDPDPNWHPDPNADAGCVADALPIGLKRADRNYHGSGRGALVHRTCGQPNRPHHHSRQGDRI
jgi:hypothetical protein